MDSVWIGGQWADEYFMKEPPHSLVNLVVKEPNPF